MHIEVCGIAREVREELTIAELLELTQAENPEYVTVVVNDIFVDRGDFAKFKLHENDRVEFLYFMGGGA